MRNSYNLSITLNFYLARQFLLTVFAATLVMLAILLLSDMLALLDDLNPSNGFTGEVMLRLVLLKAPDMVLKLVPFTIMLGTMACYARLTKNQELTALRTSGVSAWQFLLAPAVVCLLIGLFNLTALNPIAAAMLKKYEHIYTEYFPGNAKGLLVEGGGVWLKQKEQDMEMIIRANSVSSQGTTFSGVTIYRFDHAGHFQDLLSASSMTLGNSHWSLKDVALLSPNKPAIRVPQQDITTTLTPEKIRGSFTSPNTLSVWELPKFIRILKETGFSSLSHQMHFQRLLAAPLLGVAMFLLAAPFALRLTRFGGMGRLLLTGIIFGFIFYLLNNIIGAYGLSGRIPVVLAAWMPTLITGMVGIAMLLHFGEE